jgi:hypothetical protein
MSDLSINLTDEFIEQVAQRVAAILERQPSEPEGWLDAEGVAAHLALSVSQVYKLCSERGNEFPVHKEGSRSYFKASELDRWREGRQGDGNGRVSGYRIERL